VNLRVTGIGPIPTPSLPEVPPRAGDARRACTGRRRISFEGDWLVSDVYDRAALGPRDSIAGPAVIEEFGSTLPIAPGFSARVDRLGTLVLSRDGRSR
jgi:N-methylhydantoinase A